MADGPRTLGPYEIVATLDSGSMGRVFRARDQRLQRDVAIKILNKADAADRVAREARAASGLNHPNILTIFDVGQQNGLPFIVSELVEGESLRNELARGPLSIPRIFRLASQIADAMAAAHRAGLVHGDLKPENVMVSRDGRIKVIDFGLARAVTDPRQSSTAAESDTSPGLLVGTPAYASPELARGASPDKHSDQFAFGVMLFEMATGTRPFIRRSIVETLAAIINDPAPDVAAINPQVPAVVRWIIERCLSKDPDGRYASTDDLAADVRAIEQRVFAESPPNRSLSGRKPAPAVTSILAVIAFVAAGTLLWLVTRPPAAVDLTKYNLTPLATAVGFSGKPAWSPDGTTVAYSAEIDGVLQIFRRSLLSSVPEQVTRCPTDCDDPFWSADGAHIYYHALYRDQEALFRVAASGGAHSSPVLENARHADASPDGRTVAFLREASPGRFGLWLADPDGGRVRRYTRAPFDSALFSNGQLRYSPNGGRLLIWFQSSIGSRGVAETGFYDVRVDTEGVRRVLPSLSGETTPQTFDWLSDSRHIVTMRAGQAAADTHLWMANVDTDRSWPITSSTTSEGFPSASRTDRLAFTVEQTNFDVLKMSLRAGPLTPVLVTSRNEYDPAVARDGRLVYVTDRTGSIEIWQRSSDREWETPLVSQASFGSARTLALGSLAFSPDGTRLAFQRFGPEGYRLWVVGRAGGTPVRAIPGDENYQDAPTWSPNGESIAFVSGRSGRWSLSKARLGGEPQVLGSVSAIPLSRPQWSPDGRWIAFLTAQGLTLISPEGTGAHAISRSDWESIAWSPADGRLYGLRLGDDVHTMVLASIDPDTGDERLINANALRTPVANQPIRGFSWTPDGFVTSLARAQSEVWLLDGLQVDPPVLRWFRRRP